MQPKQFNPGDVLRGEVQSVEANKAMFDLSTCLDWVPVTLLLHGTTNQWHRVLIPTNGVEVGNKIEGVVGSPEPLGEIARRQLDQPKLALATVQVYGHEHQFPPTPMEPSNVRMFDPSRRKPRTPH